MKDLAGFAFNEDKTLASYTYTSNWDSERIYGCACHRSPSVDNVFHTDYTNYLSQYSSGYNLTGSADATKFYRGPYAQAVTDYWGFECGLRKCPHGDDPSTRNGVNEIQKIVCTADSGKFSLTFRENTTMAINYNEPANVFGYRLEQLFTIHAVTINYYQGNTQTAASTDSICTGDGSTVVNIEFQSEHGDLPLLEFVNIDLQDSGGSPTFAISQIQAGTKEDMECSGQGTCNEYNGVCDCRTGFGSSDGTLTGVGDRGDCSFYNRFDL